MATKEISELTNKSQPVGTDEIEIQETGGGTSKKTTLADIRLDGKYYSYTTDILANSHSGISTGYQIDTNYYDSNKTAGSGARWQFTGTTTAGKAGTVNADGYVYDADGKQFSLIEGDVRAFGVIADGSTDDYTAIAKASALGRVIDCRGLTIRVDSAISVLDNQTWLLAGAKFIFASSTQTVFDCDTVDNWNLVGPFEVQGDGSTAGTAKGVRIKDCAKFHVFCPTFTNIKGWGTYVEPGSSTTARAERGTITNPVYDSCYYGHYDLPGTGAEYMTVINVRATQCTVYGVRSAAGNVSWQGGHIVDNVADGFYLTAGSNHAHGIVNGLNINHNGQYGVRCEDVTAGETFANCHIYDNDIYIDECTDIVFDGGILDVETITNLEAEGTAGLNYIRRMQCPGDYGPTSITNGSTRPVNLIIEECWGDGAYISGLEINDPSPVYVQALRLAGSSQSFSSATPTTLVFNTEQSIGDRRNCYNNSTGVMTVPTGQTGLYRITVNLNFLGTSITADANYATVTAASSVRRVELALFGTTLLSGTITFDQFLEAGNTVFVQGFVTATSPAFGSTTSDSSLQIERIA